MSQFASVIDVCGPAVSLNFPNQNVFRVRLTEKRSVESLPHRHHFAKRRRCPSPPAADDPGFIQQHRMRRQRTLQRFHAAEVRLWQIDVQWRNHDDAYSCNRVDRAKEGLNVQAMRRRLLSHAHRRLDGFPPRDKKLSVRKILDNMLSVEINVGSFCNQIERNNALSALLAALSPDLLQGHVKSCQRVPIAGCPCLLLSKSQRRLGFEVVRFE